MRAERGFTLMEMLVALLIGAIVVSQLYILTRAISHDTTKQQMETEAMQRARIGIELLTADFQRAAMNASPNPARDPDSMVTRDEGATGQEQLAYKRPAVVHLNRDDADATDSVVLVGSFVTSNTYQAYVDTGSGNAVITIVQPFATAEDCRTEFDPDYAFAHLFAPNGQSTDARIETVTCDSRADIEVGCGCELTLADGELFADGPSAFASGQLVHVAANQAALYTVQGTSGRQALVRYFVDFDSETGACTKADLLATAEPTSAKIIADYVSDFQVWFRNVYKADGDSPEPDSPINGEWGKPRYYDLADLESSRMIPCDGAELFAAEAAGCFEGTAHLACSVTPVDGNLGPEHIRSAVIRLGVRTEKTDQEVMKLIPTEDWDAIENQDQSNDGNLMVRYNVARPPTGDVGAYKVRTVITEVAMPNVAARMSSFKRITDLE